MNIKRETIKDLRKFGKKGVDWEEFVKAYDQSYAKRQPQLFHLILSDFRQSLDEELGAGTFLGFIEGQKKFNEYKALLPTFEFCDDGGFLLPKLIKNNKTRQDDLRFKTLKYSLEANDVFAQRERVLNSKSRETIREKYGFLIDCMYPREMFEIYELCDSIGRFNCTKNKAIIVWLRIMEMMLQGEVDRIALIGQYYPDLYGAFLSQFRQML